MSTASQLRSLLARPGLVRALAPHDAFTARILEQAGIEMLFLGGFGAAASRLGVPDLGLVTPGEMAECIRSITDRVSIPLVADGDTGHGAGTAVAWTVRAFESAGAAGILLEDQLDPKRCGHFAGKQVVSVATMLDRLAQAADARRDPEFVIVARTDARAVEGLDAAIERANRYAEAGADVGFVEAPRSTGELARIAREVPLPQLANMLPGGVTPLVPLDELERMGFKVAVDPTSTLALAGFAARHLADAWLGAGGVAALGERMLSFDSLAQSLGVDELLAGDDPRQAWRRPDAVAHVQRLLDSFARFVGRELIPRDAPVAEQARLLFEAPFVVVSHGIETDPLLTYGNRTALRLWEMPWEVLTRTPSRLTAEPVHRDERARLLERTRVAGFVDDYAGIRISRSGSRFRIERAVVWNIVDAAGVHHGQAATFAHWTPVDTAAGAS
jgi:2,3-dimethylmalate lyase